MTHKTRPPGLPSEVSNAIYVLGDGVRAAIIHHLRNHGPTTAASIATQLRAPQGTVHVHTLILERAGIAKRTPDPGGDTKATRWDIDVERVDELTNSWARFLAGPQEPS